MPKYACNLSKREREILALVAEGLSSEQIARQLFISIRTVETHRRNIITKSGAQSAVALVKYAIRLGLLRHYRYEGQA